MYSDYIDINKNFQSSVNLELDLNSEKKISEYIPTRDICDVLNRYFKSINYASNERATTLVGPYGKGKSFLLLVLSYLIRQDPSSGTYKDLLKKIRDIDNDLYENIVSFNKSGKKLLPVIINSNYDNLNQAFMLALNEALKREDIGDIVPETAYSVCLDIISKWNAEEGDFSKTLKRCKDELGFNLNKIEMGLKDYSAEAYHQFVSLYNCVTHGMPFNPLVNDDIVHVYSQVDHELKMRGFDGMFIIFDEFSKFLETSNDSVSKNLKIIQDIAEAASRSSKDEQLHICCITHKSLALYKTADKADSFMTVEGRFKEIKFNRSLDENYHIISAAIDNEKGTNKIKSFIKKHESFYKAVQEFEPFNRDINKKDLLYGCFPMNPITVYSLIQLSEFVAQNERTLFTFICDVDDNSLNTFIHRNDDGLLNVDEIYDYFSPLLRREEGNEIRNIWYRTEGILSRIEDETQRKMIKSLAVILMINDPDVFPASEENLALATMLSEKTVLFEVNKLIEEGYLRKNVINNLLSFASSNNKEIEDRISIISQTKANSIAVESVLNEINATSYLLPRRYNEQNKMTRFYKVSFITEKQLKSMNSFNIFKEESFSDGLVLYLIRKTMTDEEIKERFEQFNDESAILKYPKNAVTPLLYDELIRYVSIQEMLNKDGIDEVVTEELELLLQEATEDIRKIIEKSYETDFSYLPLLDNGANDFNELLSRQMDRVYFKKIIFNNELVNKNTLTATYQKAVNNVLDDLLYKTEKVFSPTSPEATIHNSVLKKINEPDEDADIPEVMNGIKEEILNAENEKLMISDLVDKYTKAPFGIRKGIMTILITEAINELSDNVILYFKNKEIDLTANNLVKAVYSDSDYYFRCSKGTNAQNDYMVNLLDLFKKEPTSNFRVNNKILSEELRKAFVGLPSILRNAEKDNVFGIKDEMIDYKKCFINLNINPYEVVFEKPLEIFNTENYDAPEKEIVSFVNGWRSVLQEYKESLISGVKERFMISSGTSLHMGLNGIVQESLSGSKAILDEKNARILSVITNLSFDDIEAINELANAVTGLYIEDWINDRSDLLYSDLERFVNGISSSRKIDTSSSSLDKLMNEVANEERSEMGKLLQNSIESVIDEFGDSVSSSEKISIFTEVLKKYL